MSAVYYLLAYDGDAASAAMQWESQSRIRDEIAVWNPIMDGYMPDFRLFSELDLHDLTQMIKLYTG